MFCKERRLNQGTRYDARFLKKVLQSASFFVEHTLTKSLNKAHEKLCTSSEITNTITSNETATKKLLQQRKFKKFTSLKYKPKPAVKTVVNNNEGSRTTEEQPRLTKASYAQALKSNTNTFEKVNSPNHHENKPNKNINGRLRSFSPANRRPKQGIIRSRNTQKPIYHLITNTSKKLHNLKRKLNY